MTNHELTRRIDALDTHHIRPTHPELYLVPEHESQIGNTVMGYAGIGTFIPTDVPDLGFRGGYAFNSEYNPFTPHAQDERVQYATLLAERALSRRERSGADILIVASSTSYDTIAVETQEALRRRNFTIDTALYAGLACNGAIEPIMSLSRDPSYNGCEVVLITVDTVSGTIIDQSPNPEDVIVRNLFGNGATYIAITIGRDLIHYFGKTVVDPAKDEIQTVPMNEFPRGTLPPPPNYEFWGDGETIYARTESGFYLNLPLSTDGKLRSRGARVLGRFATNGGKVVYDILHLYRENYESALGSLGEAWMHQPSLPVVRAFTKATHLHTLEKYGIPRGFAKNILAQREDIRNRTLQELNIPNDLFPTFPWVMDQTDMNNIVAGTANVALTEMVKSGRIRPGVRIPVIGLALGNEYSADIVEFTAV
ncbi:hypothetical protein HY408_00920 [Candidatus Gottesmanbacteria bacterium]|nr:hypothetical protein [Candidatus Gottesmanbacteria bacterium]